LEEAMTGNQAHGMLLLRPIEEWEGLAKRDSQKVSRERTESMHM
jgi:hypothetical protein